MFRSTERTGERAPRGRRLATWTLALSLFITGQARAIDLRPGDIIINEPTIFGEILRLDPFTGDLTHITAGGLLPHAQGRMALDSNGDLIVISEQGLLRVDPVTGAQTLIAPREAFIHATSIAIEANGDLIVTDSGVFKEAGAILRVDPVTGAQTVISSGGHLIFPGGVAIDGNGDFLVVDHQTPGGSGYVLRIDPQTGAQTIVSSGGSFVDPTDIAIDENGDLLIADANAFGGLCPLRGCGGIIRVDPETGAQTTVSALGIFTNPLSIAIEADGSLLVVDAHAFTGLPPRLIRVDPDTGKQTLVSSAFASAFDLLVVPGTPTAPAPFCGDHQVNQPHEQCDSTAKGSCPGACNPDCTCFSGLTPGDLVMTDRAHKAVVHVDPTTGDRIILSSADVGSGPEFETPRGIAIENDGNILVTDLSNRLILPHKLVDLNRILRIDPVTGNRSIVSSNNVGAGPFLGHPWAIGIEADGHILVGTFSPTALLRIDPTTGDRAVLSSQSAGTGPDFTTPQSIAVEADGNILFVSGWPGLVYRVDPLTGDRTIASGNTIGTGPRLTSSEGIALDSDGEILVADPGNGFGDFTALFRVDPITSNRTIFSGCTGSPPPPCPPVGSGTAFVLPRDLEVEQDGNIIVIDPFRDALFRVDPLTGDRSLFSSPGMGTGPELLLPWSFEIVPMDLDTDQDGHPDVRDRCPSTPLYAVTNTDGCSIGQAVPCKGPASGGIWKNHGAYVSALAGMAGKFAKAGLITKEKKSKIITEAAQGACGR